MAAHPERIGPFRIHGVIGHGAMGIVYEAEQDRPHRRVALKVIRTGAVRPAALRRFELESEILGRLQHPGIAQIYQAGVEETSYGPQPYFAMELVPGRRLDEFVRSTTPPLRARLQLVAAIADAVHHAHQRGVIHRDLKPANILVNGAGEPKVLDFGIARAHDEAFSGEQTAAGEVLGTLNYMSPEQISGDHAAIDTRADVYALGVILYEVLAQRPPYQIARKTLAEAARIIHDEEPTRLRAAAADVPADVETIVAKALEKDRERRYQSAAEFAEDLRRFLRDEPIAARTPTASYQLRKFARRHKGVVAGLVAAFVVLALGVIATSWQAVRARRAERAAQAQAREADVERAKAEAVTRFLTETLSSVDPSEARGRDVSVRDALDAAAARIDAGAMKDQPAVEMAVRNAIGTTYAGLGLLDAAERQLRAAAALGERSGVGPALRGDTQARLVDALYSAGKPAEAEPAAREALKLRREAYGSNHADVASSLDDLGAILMSRGDMAQAEPLMREALAIKRNVHPPGHHKVAVSLNNLGFLTWRKGNLEEAESLYREALAIDRRALGADHPEIATRLLNLAILYRDWGRPADAEPLAREALDVRRRIMAPDHPEIADGHDVLAGILESRGQHAEAARLLREAVAIALKAHGEVNLNTARMQHNLALVLWKEGAYAEAGPLFRVAVANIARTYGPAYRGHRLAMANQAHNLNGLRDARAAEARAREALALYRQAPADAMVATALLALGHALMAQGRGVDASSSLREALGMIEKQPSARYPWLKGDIQSTLGVVVAAQGRPEEAEKLLLDGHEALRASPATPAHRLRAAVERLADFYAAQGRATDAASWRRRAS